MRRTVAIVCAYLPASGLKTLYGHELYDPVYEAAAETGLPLAIHSVEAVYPAFPFQLEQFRTALAVHSLAHPLAMVANIVSMLETAVPVRWPDVRFAFMEAGTGWVPWLANRLDKEYIERRREVPLLQERPSHYMRGFFYGTQPIEEPERANGHREAVRAVRRREHRHVRVGLAAPRLRPHPVRLRPAVLARGAAQDHGPERSPLLLPRGPGVNREPSEHAVGSIEDLPPGEHRIVRVANREIGVFNIDGSAARDPEPLPAPARPLCAGARLRHHRLRAAHGWKLAWIWDGEVVTCPWHSLEFHVPDRAVRRAGRHPPAHLRGAGLRRRRDPGGGLGAGRTRHRRGARPRHRTRHRAWRSRSAASTSH